MFPINNLTFLHKSLKKKREKSKLKESKRKCTINIRAEIIKIKNRKQWRSSKNQVSSLKRSIILTKFSQKVQKEKEKKLKLQISGIKEKVLLMTPKFFKRL